MLFVGLIIGGHISPADWSVLVRVAGSVLRGRGVLGRADHLLAPVLLDIEGAMIILVPDPGLLICGRCRDRVFLKHWLHLFVIVLIENCKQKRKKRALRVMTGAR